MVTTRRCPRSRPCGAVLASGDGGGEGVWTTHKVLSRLPQPAQNATSVDDWRWQLSQRNPSAAPHRPQLAMRVRSAAKQFGQCISIVVAPNNLLPKSTPVAVHHYVPPDDSMAMARSTELPGSRRYAQAAIALAGRCPACAPHCGRKSI